MNTNYYFLKKHIFKKRNHSNIALKLIKFKVGTLGIFSSVKQKFEFVYLRFFKKTIRRKYCKAYTKFNKSKYWMFLKSNFIYSSKSKNSRMGAGVGILVRLVSIIYSYSNLFEFIGFSKKFLKKVCLYLNFKCNVNLVTY